MADFSLASGLVKAVQVTNRWRKDDAGARTVRAVIRTGGVDFEGSDVSPATTYGSDSEMWEQNPDTAAAWSLSDIDALEAGYKVQS